MRCQVCGKEFDKVVEFEGLQLETKGADKHYFCSWNCYIEDTKRLYNHITEVLDEIAAKRAKAMEKTSELSEKEIEKIEKEKKAWFKQRLDELKLKEPDNPRPAPPDDTKQRTKGKTNYEKKTRKRK